MRGPEATVASLLLGGVLVGGFVFVSTVARTRFRDALKWARRYGQAGEMSVAETLAWIALAMWGLWLLGIVGASYFTFATVNALLHSGPPHS